MCVGLCFQAVISFIFPLLGTDRDIQDGVGETLVELKRKVSNLLTDNVIPDNVFS